MCPSEEQAPRPADRLQSLERGLAVIRAFGDEAPVQTLSEVADRVGLPRAAARRYLLTLESLGYVRSDGRRFSLTPRVMELGYAYLSGLSLAELAGPHLETLAAATASPAPCRSSTAPTSSTSRAWRRRGSCAWRSRSGRASRPGRRRWAGCCSPRWSRTSSTRTCPT